MLSTSMDISGTGVPDPPSFAMQIIGRAFNEETVLRVGQVLEESAQFTHLPAFIAGAR